MHEPAEIEAIRAQLDSSRYPLSPSAGEKNDEPRTPRKFKKTNSVLALPLSTNEFLVPPNNENESNPRNVR